MDREKNFGRLALGLDVVAVVLLGLLLFVVLHQSSPVNYPVERAGTLGIAEGTHLGSLTVDNLEVTASSTFDAAVTNTGTSTLNGLATIVKNVTFTDATNTQFCQLNPFAATSTAEVVSVNASGIATTSVALVVATSTQSVGLTTSTVGFGVSNPAQLLNINLLGSGTATGTTFFGGGITDVRSAQTTATAAKVVVNPNEYVCGVTGEGNGGSTAGITNAANLFAGSVKLLFKR